ncbi:MAG: hypothetical protein NTZ79_11260 [Proteobacteria bacterium]|nr:hypothetical protein [Pseudomonadota bacterium]
MHSGFGTTLALVATILSGCASSDTGASRSSGLRVNERSVLVRLPQMTVTPPAGFRVTGPHHFSKQEDNGYHFEVSLVSYVSPQKVVSVVAEHLVEDVPLNYEDLPQAQWPNAAFLARASGCASMTSSAAAAMPAESGMSWILQAGFDPNGSFAYETALLVAPDRRHEASIELIARVASCNDPAGIEAALKSLRNRIKVANR